MIDALINRWMLILLNVWSLNSDMGLWSQWASFVTFSLDASDQPEASSAFSWHLAGKCSLSAALYWLSAAYLQLQYIKKKKTLLLHCSLWAEDFKDDSLLTTPQLVMTYKVWQLMKNTCRDVTDRVLPEAHNTLECRRRSIFYAHWFFKTTLSWSFFFCFKSSSLAQGQWNT